MGMSKFGDWVRAGVVLQALSVNLQPMFQAQLKEDGEFILEKLIDHLDAQDLNWTPLSPRTIALKGGSTEIYVDTGFLRDNLEVRKVKAPKGGATLFIGASAWKTHEPSGAKFSDLMIWLEYGTDRIPPRPFIRPTFDEIQPLIQDNWEKLLKDLIDKGGS